jgi:hypothetical protein
MSRKSALSGFSPDLSASGPMFSEQLFQDFKVAIGSKNDDL